MVDRIVTYMGASFPFFSVRGGNWWSFGEVTSERQSAAGQRRQQHFLHHSGNSALVKLKLLGCTWSLETKYYIGVKSSSSVDSLSKRSSSIWINYILTCLKLAPNIIIWSFNTTNNPLLDRCSATALHRSVRLEGCGKGRLGRRLKWWI